MPKTLLDEIGECIAQFRETVSAKLAQWARARSPQAFSGVEEEAHAAARKLADDIVAAVLREILADVAFQAQCLAGAHSVGAYRSKGFKETWVTLLGGNSYAVRSQYLVAPVRGRARRRRRGQRSVALWPCLVALGIWWNTSPALASETSRQIADSCSFRDGLEALKRRGVDLGYKRTLALYQRFSQRAVEQRDQWVSKMVASGQQGSSALKGRRVQVSIDGGRCRERRVKRGRRRNSGHHAYYTPWREPRQLVVYILDDQGRPDRRFLPLYDGTLGDADALFFFLWAYLAALGISEAKQVIFVADGAKWIWGRTPWPWAALGLDPEKVVEVVDWYHAVETLHTIAKQCRWSEARRHRWVHRVEGYLYDGDVDRVVAEIDALAVGRRAKSVLEDRDYFVRNVRRMQYQELRARRGCPLTC